jgi:hypothetical protein
MWSASCVTQPARERCWFRAPRYRGFVTRRRGPGARELRAPSSVGSRSTTRTWCWSIDRGSLKMRDRGIAVNSELRRSSRFASRCTSCSRHRVLGNPPRTWVPSSSAVCRSCCARVRTSLVQSGSGPGGRALRRCARGDGGVRPRRRPAREQLSPETSSSGVTFDEPTSSGRRGVALVWPVGARSSGFALRLRARTLARLRYGRRSSAVPREGSGRVPLRREARGGEGTGRGPANTPPRQRRRT